MQHARRPSEGFPAIKAGHHNVFIADWMNTQEGPGGMIRGLLLYLGGNPSPVS